MQFKEMTFDSLRCDFKTDEILLEIVIKVLLKKNFAKRSGRILGM